MDGNTMVLLESYGARLARQGLAASTRRKYLAAVDRFLCSFDGADPASVTRQQVDDYLDRWHAAEQPAPASVRLHLSALKSFYGYLDDRGLLEGRNPVERIKAPRVRRRPNDRLRAEEAEAMLAACLSEQEKVLIWLLRWTGLRVGEALGLTVEDVDLERRVIRVRASKTDAGLRTVPVVDELASSSSPGLSGCVPEPTGDPTCRCSPPAAVPPGRTRSPGAWSSASHIGRNYASPGPGRSSQGLRRTRFAGRTPPT
jgi:integrase